MSIETNGHMASWVAEEHKGELGFVIARADGVHVATQDWVFEQAYTDAHDDRHEFGSDWTLVHVWAPISGVLHEVELEIKDMTLIITNLVTGEVHKFGLE